MSLVERLAEGAMAEEIFGTKAYAEMVARHFLNALAEELEAEDAKFSNDTPYAQIARWIQANSEGP